MKMCVLANGAFGKGLDRAFVSMSRYAPEHFRVLCEVMDLILRKYSSETSKLNKYTIMGIMAYILSSTTLFVALGGAVNPRSAGKEIKYGWIDDDIDGLAFSHTGELYWTRGGTIWRLDTNRVVHPVLPPDSSIPDYVACAVAVNKHGTVVVADMQHHVIVEILKYGVASVLGGHCDVSGFRDGSRYCSLFSQPCGIALDNDDNIIIADYGNNAVRCMCADETKTIVGRISDSEEAYYIPGVKHNSDESSLDGDASVARIMRPRFVAVDKWGRIIVVNGIDAANSENAIKVVERNGMVRTLAGKPFSQECIDGVGTNASFYSIGGVAVDGNGTVFVTDRYAIRQITKDGVVSSFAGKLTDDGSGSDDGKGKSAKFKNPKRLAFSPSGFLCVSDGDRLRCITPDGMVSTLQFKVNEDEMQSYKMMMERWEKECARRACRRE